jgi:hypothetical protein
MNPIKSSQWTGSKDNAIIAQIDIGDEEIIALGGVLERSDADLGPTILESSTNSYKRQVLREIGSRSSFGLEIMLTCF